MQEKIKGKGHWEKKEEVMSWETKHLRCWIDKQSLKNNIRHGCILWKWGCSNQSIATKTNHIFSTVTYTILSMAAAVPPSASRLKSGSMWNRSAVCVVFALFVLALDMNLCAGLPSCCIRMVMQLLHAGASALISCRGQRETCCLSLFSQLVSTKVHKSSSLSKLLLVVMLKSVTAVEAVHWELRAGLFVCRWVRFSSAVCLEGWWYALRVLKSNYHIFLTTAVPYITNWICSMTVVVVIICRYENNFPHWN